MDTSAFIGLGKRPAQNLCESRNLIFHLVSVDGEEFLGYPKDQRTDRVCCEIVDDKVSSAVIQ